MFKTLQLSNHNANIAVDIRDQHPKKHYFTSGKLSDSIIIKMLETAMDEMVRFEVSDQSPYAF